jgi:hypothetical protein
MLSGGRLLLTTATLVLCSCSTSKLEVRPLTVGFATGGTEIEEAKRHFLLGNVAMASEIYRAVLRHRPKDTAALNGLAACYDRMGRFELSRRYYEEALAVDPSSPTTRHNFALSLKMQGLESDIPFILPSEQPPAAVAEAAAETPQPLELPSYVAEQVSHTMPGREQGRPVLERLSLAEVELKTTNPEPARNLKTAAQDAVVGVQMGRVIQRTATEVVVRFDEPVSATSARQAARLEDLKVMNAVGRRGQAARLRQFLATKGWKGVGIGDAAEIRSASIIIYPVGAQLRAQELAQQLPFPVRTAPSAKANRLILMIGKNAVPFDDELQQRARS